MRAPLGTLLRSLPVAALLPAVAALSGCPTTECQGYNDCDVGYLCNVEGVCVVDTFDPGDGGTINPNPNPTRDAGPGGTQTLRITTSFNNVTFLQPDPRDATRAIYGEYLESGASASVDDVRAFRIADGQKEPAPESLLPMVEGACRLDSIIDPAVPTSELWYNCDRAPGLRIVYDEDPFDVTQNETDAAHVVFATSPTGNEWPRRLVAARGGTLRSYQVRSTDGLGNPRFTDAFATPISGVVSVLAVDRASLNGDFAAVFTRATGAQLIPIQRQLGQEQWQAAGQLQTRTLPDDTHLVAQLGTIYATGAAQNLDIPNYMTIHPATGQLRFWRYESGQEILPATVFESDTTMRSDAPAATVRPLLVWSPSRQYLFYARTDKGRVWRLPIVGGAENDVRFAVLDRSDLQPTGLIAVDDETVWVSYGNLNQIQRVKTDQGGM